jgi:hypothetical protein
MIVVTLYNFFCSNIHELSRICGYKLYYPKLLFIHARTQHIDPSTQLITGVISCYSIGVDFYLTDK